MKILVKSIVSFFVLLLLTRLLGKKQMNQITYFDYITGITLGSIAANISIEDNVSIISGLISFAAWSGLAFLIGFLAQKSYAIRNFFDGEPEIIIKDGRLIASSVKKTHLNMDDVTMLLREKDIFSISDVEYAILEPHGKLSVLKKPELGSVTKKDMNVPTPAKSYLPTDIIIDGKVINKNMRELGYDYSWLSDKLSSFGLRLSDVKKVLYMTTLEDGNVYLSIK